MKREEGRGGEGIGNRGEGIVPFSTSTTCHCDLTHLIVQLSMLGFLLLEGNYGIIHTKKEGAFEEIATFKRRRQD